MAKFFGAIGFADTVEVSPGVYEEQITTRNYYGDVNRNTRRLESSSQLNDNINVSNEISIVADAFADLNFYKMRYVEYKGVRWKITNIEVERPRLKLSVGGVYNGE